MKGLIAFIVCVLVSFVHGKSNWPIILNEDHVVLGEATALLTRKYFSPTSNTVVIIERSFQSSMRLFNIRTLEYILSNLQETMTVQLYNGRSQNQPWEYHIFVVDSIQAFDNIQWNFPRTFYERDFRFLIVLTKYDPDFLHTLKRIFESCHRFRVYNANIILNHPRLGVAMFKYDLFTKFKCNRVQPYLYFRFNDGLHKLLEVFPQKLLNFWGCPLRITARINSPVLTFSGNRDNPVFEKEWKSLSGYDGELLKIISHRLNFTIILLPFPRGKTYFLNKTGYGCFADLLEERADIAIGGFSASDPKRHVLTPSIIYHQTPVVYVIHGGKELDSMSRLARPFSFEVWKRLGICLLLVTAALLSLRFVDSHIRNLIIGQWNRSPVLNVLAVFLGYPMTRLPINYFARYLLTLWLLMTLIIRNAYQGSLFDAFRTDKLLRIPEGYDELIEWDYMFVGSYYFSGSDVFPQNRTITTMSTKNYSSRLELLEQKIGRYATVALRDNVLEYVAHNTSTKLKMLSKPVYLHSSSLFFQKHSIYARSFNINLKRFRYSGILQCMFRHFLKDTFMYKFLKQNTYVPQAITIFRIRGAFEIFIGMMTLATLAFALELLSVYLEKLQYFLSWIN